jgi:hypothetical protein
MAYKYCTATKIEASQTTWDALSAEEQEFNPRPVKYNLP